jgi:hypothetical protein
MSSGISANLLKQIQDTLLACGPFASQAALSATFIDSRISIWRQALPETNSAAGRITELIAFLMDRYNPEGENGLVLFLQVLSDQFDERDKCHHKLLQCANALKNERENPDFRPAPKEPTVDEKAKHDQSVSAGGDISGQVALGDNNLQIGEIHGGSVTIQLGRKGSAKTPLPPDEK